MSTKQRKEERRKKRRQIGKVKKKKEKMDEVLTVYGGRRPLRMYFPARFTFSGQRLAEFSVNPTKTSYSDDTKGKAAAFFLLKWVFFCQWWWASSKSNELGFSVKNHILFCEFLFPPYHFFTFTRPLKFPCSVIKILIMFSHFLWNSNQFTI